MTLLELGFSKEIKLLKTNAGETRLYSIIQWPTLHASRRYNKCSLIWSLFFFFPFLGYCFCLQAFLLPQGGLFLGSYLQMQS